MECTSYYFLWYHVEYLSNFNLCFFIETYWKFLQSTIPLPPTPTPTPTPSPPPPAQMKTIKYLLLVQLLCWNDYVVAIEIYSIFRNTIFKGLFQHSRYMAKHKDSSSQLLIQFYMTQITRNLGNSVFRYPSNLYMFKVSENFKHCPSFLTSQGALWTASDGGGRSGGKTFTNF